MTKHMKTITIVCIFSILISSIISAQSVIVNEMSQGNGGYKEWVELLVVDNNVDMRNWELGENDDGVWNSIVTFSNASQWQSVRSGTLIVVFNQDAVDDVITASGSDDTDFSDFNVTIAANNTTFFLDPWTGLGEFGNSDSDDCAAIRDDADVMVHDMAVTHGVPTVAAPTVNKTKFYASDNVASVINNANWIVDNALNAIPGQPNGGANTVWINFLRRVPTVAVSIWSVVIALGLIFAFTVWKIHVRTKSEI